MKKAKPITMKSSGTDNPAKYIGGWEEYTTPQGIADRQDKRVLAMETGAASNDTLPLSPALVTLAKTFLRDKWTERYYDRRGSDATNPPTDMKSSCKFVSMFVQQIFGGEIQGNWNHQYNIIDGKIVDLNIDEPDVISLTDPHYHDAAFWGNPDHKRSTQSCQARVANWVAEFKSNVDVAESVSIAPLDRYAPEGDGMVYIVGPVERRLIKQSKKAPKKLVRATVRALSARGLPPHLDPHRMTETIRRAVTGSLNNDYEIVNGENEVVGISRVVDGVIDVLDFYTETGRYRGQVLSALLSFMTADADRNSANMSIDLADTDGDIVAMFERFGFRRISNSMMQRGLGSLRPTDVNIPQGMTNRS